MSRDNHPSNWSRPFIEAAIKSIELAGDRPDLVTEYRALLPDAADYSIDHRERDCRRTD